MIVKSLTGIDIGINYVHQIPMYKMTIAHAGKDVVITYLFIINSLRPSLSLHLVFMASLLVDLKWQNDWNYSVTSNSL